MSKALVYIHGKGGSAAEAEHYKLLFAGADVIGFDYRAETPWEAKAEFSAFFAERLRGCDAVCIVANSIGAFFAMHALADAKLEKAYFISPIVDMEALILGMMHSAGIDEATLRARGQVETPFGEILDYAYLSYVRAHPLVWRAPTAVLYGEQDLLHSREAVESFAARQSLQ